jgi:hypothetical protein
MNSQRLFLVISLVLNLVLAGACVWLVKTRPVALAPSVDSEQKTAATAPSSSVESADGQTSPSTPVTAKPAQSFDWRLVESEDYKKYIANLRSIGCPEETIRDIIIADVNKLFASRKRAMNSSTNKFEFWKAGNVFGNIINEERIQQQQALAREKRELLKELLGVAPEEKPDFLGGLNPFETMLDFLPADKQTEVSELFTKFQAKMVKGISGSPDGEDMKNMQKMQKEMEAELAKILTPEELENYQLRMSQTAMMMRMQLSAFEPNEQEFRDIFKLKKGFDDDYGPYGMVSQDKTEREKYNTAKKELDAKIKGLLGDSRYVEYERSQDWNFQTMDRIATKNKLGRDAAVKVYDMKKAAEEHANKVRQDKQLSAEQRTEALRAIRAETERSIQTVFGDTGWNSYRNQQAAYWIKSISPDPKND